MNQKLRDAMVKAMKFQQQFISSDREKVCLAQCIITNSKDEVTIMAIDPACFQDWRKKNQVAATMLLTLFQDTEGTMVFVTDALFAVVKTQEEFHELRRKYGTSLRDWPADKRREVLLCTGNCIGECGENAMQEYTRDITGQPIFKEPVFEKMNQSRFTFDLTSRNIEDALLQLAMHDGNWSDKKPQ